MSLISLKFKYIILQFFGFSEVSELRKTIQNLTKRCNVSTKIISKATLLTRYLSIAKIISAKKT